MFFNVFFIRKIIIINSFNVVVISVILIMRNQKLIFLQFILKQIRKTNNFETFLCLFLKLILK